MWFLTKWSIPINLKEFMVCFLITLIHLQTPMRCWASFASRRKDFCFARRVCEEGRGRPTSFRPRPTLPPASGLSVERRTTNVRTRSSWNTNQDYKVIREFKKVNYLYSIKLNSKLIKLLYRLQLTNFFF